MHYQSLFIIFVGNKLHASTTVICVQSTSSQAFSTNSNYIPRCTISQDEPTEFHELYTHTRAYLYFLFPTAGSQVYKFCLFLMRSHLSVLLSDYPLQLWMKPHILVLFTLHPTRFLLKIDGQVLGISTFEGLIVGSGILSVKK